MFKAPTNIGEDSIELGNWINRQRQTNEESNNSKKSGRQL